MVDVKKHHTFFGKFHRRNFDARRIFYEKLIFGFFEKRQKWPYDLQKYDFSAISAIIGPISWIWPPNDPWTPYIRDMPKNSDPLPPSLTQG